MHILCLSLVCCRHSSTEGDHVSVTVAGSTAHRLSCATDVCAPLSLWATAAGCCSCIHSPLCSPFPVYVCLSVCVSPPSIRVAVCLFPPDLEVFVSVSPGCCVSVPLGIPSLSPSCDVSVRVLWTVMASHPPPLRAGVSPARRTLAAAAGFSHRTATSAPQHFWTGHHRCPFCGHAHCSPSWWLPLSGRGRGRGAAPCLCR